MCVPVSPAPALHKFIQMYTVVTITIDFLCMQTTVHLYQSILQVRNWSLIFHSHTQKRITNFQKSTIYCTSPKPSKKHPPYVCDDSFFPLQKSKGKPIFLQRLSIHLGGMSTYSWSSSCGAVQWCWQSHRRSLIGSYQTCPPLKKKRVGGEVLLLVDDSLM